MVLHFNVDLICVSVEGEGGDGMEARGGHGGRALGLLLVGDVPGVRTFN
jgi:hypothetical protein